MEVEVLAAAQQRCREGTVRRDLTVARSARLSPAFAGRGAIMTHERKRP